MRQRVTFLIKPDGPPTNPHQFDLSTEVLEVKDLYAARQERWTIALHELPATIQRVLEQLPEVHVKWSTKSVYQSLDPFSTRAPAGLHVLTASGGESNGQDLLCSFLGDIFGKDVNCTRETFTEIPGPIHQLHRAAPGLTSLVSFLQTSICSGKRPCLDEIASLATADYVDIDYIGPDNPLIFTAFWSRSAGDGTWKTKVRKLTHDHRVEIGIFDKRPPVHDEQKLTFGGILSVIGESEQFKETLFSFHPRHQHNIGTYTGAFKKPTGLHPKFTLDIKAGEPPEEECNLNAYFTLPPTFFVDKYQLADKQLQESLGLRGFKGPYGEADLEAPVWTQIRWGSTVLLQIANPENSTKEAIHIELPLHLRYLEPAPGGGNVLVEMPWPVVFWACPSTVWEKYTISPFDRKDIGYEHMFGEDTGYHHLSPADTVQETISTLEVPVLNLDNAGTIKLATAILVGLGFVYITAKILMSMIQGTKHMKVE